MRTKEDINQCYTQYNSASECYCFVDGYFLALRDNHIITEEQYAQARRWNGSAYETFKQGDNDE